MKGYFECGKCRRQWTREGSTMGNSCPACGFKGGRCEIGAMAKPAWFDKATVAAPELKPKSFWDMIFDFMRAKP